MCRQLPNACLLEPSINAKNFVLIFKVQHVKRSEYSVFLNRFRVSEYLPKLDEKAKA